MEIMIYEIIDPYNYEDQSDFLGLMDVIRTVAIMEDKQINTELDAVVFFLNLN